MLFRHLWKLKSSFDPSDLTMMKQREDLYSGWTSTKIFEISPMESFLGWYLKISLTNNSCSGLSCIPLEVV